MNYFFIRWSTIDKIFSKPEDVKAFKHVLIPGAGNAPLGEKQNPRFASRMNAAVKLYSENHLTQIVCSGISGIPQYNEPHDMKEFLINKNVPANIIIEDDGAENTYETIQHYSTKFPNDSVVIVSQPMHLERALFIAEHFNLNAVGFAAIDSRDKFNIEAWLYEVLAKVKCTWELTVGC